MARKGAWKLGLGDLPAQSKHLYFRCGLFCVRLGRRPTGRGLSAQSGIKF